MEAFSKNDLLEEIAEKQVPSKFDPQEYALSTVFVLQRHWHASRCICAALCFWLGCVLDTD